MKKFRTLISMGSCLVLSMLLVFVGVYASTSTKLGVSFNVSYENGLYAKVYASTSNETSIPDNRYFYPGTGDFSTSSSLLVADSYTGDYFGDTPYVTSLSVTNANCDKYGYFTVYIYIENYSNFEIWSDIKVNYGTTTTDLNSASASNYNYTTNAWEDISARTGTEENPIPNTSLRVISFKAKNSSTAQNLTINIALCKTYNYLESSGTQYIDSGFVPNSNTSVEVSYLSNINAKWILGSRLAGTCSDRFCLYYSNETIIYPQFGSLGQTITVSSMAGLQQTDKLDRNLFYHNGSLIYTFATQTFTGTYSMYLFGLNQTGVLEYRVFIGKIYSCKMWNNSTLVRDFIPAKDSDKTPCMYDKVSKAFFYNQGTGTFSIG